VQANSRQANQVPQDLPRDQQVPQGLYHGNCTSWRRTNRYGRRHGASGFCCGSNWCNDTSIPSISGTTFSSNAIQACGEGGHVFGKSSGCRHEAVSGSAPMAGGAGVWTSYNHCCPCSINSPAPGGQFPGGGGGGAFAACCCGACNCSGCGAAGLVRIWF